MALPPILSKHPQSSNSKSSNPQRSNPQRSNPQCSNPKCSTKKHTAVGLQTLLLCFFVGISLIPLSFLGVWVYNSALTTTEQAVVEKHQLIAKNISDELAGYAADLDALFKARSQGKPKPFTDEGKMLMRSKHIQAFAFAKDDAVMYCMGDESWLPKAGIGELSYERKVAWLRPEKTRISPVLINSQGKPTVYLLRVNRDRYLTIAAVSTDYFMQVQQRISFGESGHAAIVDHKGNVLAHPLSQWEQNARNLTELEPIARMQENSEGIARFFSPAMKAEMIAGYAIVPRIGWGVMIPQRYGEVRAQARQTKHVAMAVSLLGIGLAVTLSWQLTRYILRPIQLVIQAAKKLESGQPSAPLIGALPASHSGHYHRLPNLYHRLPKEFVNLLTAFDTMAAEVSSVRTTLEQRVEERTQALSEEVKRREQLEQQLIQQATHDALTGLPNRRLLTDRLESLIALSKRSNSLFAVLFLDLDGFKQVNDTYGHKTGDALLVEISQRLKSSLRKSDAIFRLGGDEFVILVERIVTLSTAQTLTQMLADKLIETLRSPLLIDGDEISIGVSIGISIGRGQKSAQQILADADAAMYKAKLEGNCAIIH